MAQRPKTEVREAILRAAGQTFAERGLEGAVLGDIVARAGTSIGNLYKYFANKDELFKAFLPPTFTTELTQLVRARVLALRGEANGLQLDAGHPYLLASKDLLDFTLAHRTRVVFLLLHAARTKHETFVRDLVRVLVGLAVHHARTAHPTVALTPATKRALTRIYRGYVAALGATLAEERSDHATREALGLHSTYHLSGLGALLGGLRR